MLFCHSTLNCRRPSASVCTNLGVLFRGCLVLHHVDIVHYSPIDGHLGCHECFMTRVFLYMSLCPHAGILVEKVPQSGVSKTIPTELMDADRLSSKKTVLIDTTPISILSRALLSPHPELHRADLEPNPNSVTALVTLFCSFLPF